MNVCVNYKSNGIFINIVYKYLYIKYKSSALLEDFIKL